MFDIQRLIKKLGRSFDQTEVMSYLVLGLRHEYSIQRLLGVSRFDIGEVEAPGFSFTPTFEPTSHRPFIVRFP
jgi:hypothetical protein